MFSFIKKRSATSVAVTNQPVKVSVKDVSFPIPIRNDLQKATRGLLGQVGEMIDTIRGLQKSNTVLNGVYGLIADAVVRISGSGIVRDANASAEALFKSTYDNLIGSTVKDLLGLDFETIKALSRSSKATEITLVDSQGQEIFVQVSLTRISHMRGDETEYVAVVRDMSEMLKLKQALIANGLKLEALYSALDESKDSILITDAQNHVVFVNKAYTEHTGYPLSEIIGLCPNFHSAGLVEAATYEDMWQALSKGEMWTGNFVNRSKGGELLFDKTVITPVMIPGTKVPTYYVAVKHFASNKPFEVTTDEKLSH